MKEIGKYKVIEEIGKGGMGVVYKAYDPLMERHVAIKVLSDWAFNQPVMKERFYREARASGKLSHDNITTIHDLGEHEGVPYIVMEYLRGTDLRALLTENKKIDLTQKLNYARQICSGLAYSHSKHIVHRDIKPENIRVLEDGKIKIMDFGIARLTTSTMTMTGTVMGTPYYMSPEQVKGEKVGPTSDIFSLGVLLYELLTSQLPFPGDNPTTVGYKIVHESPQPITHVELIKIKGLQDLILKCLQKNPNDRFTDAKEIAGILTGLIKQIQQKSKTNDSKQQDAVANQFKKIKKNVTSLLRKKQYADALALVNAFIASHPGYSSANDLLDEIKTKIADAKAEAQKTKILKPQAHTQTGKTSFPNKKLLVASGATLILIIAVFLSKSFFSNTTPEGYVALNIIPWAELVALNNNEGIDVKQSFFDNKKIITPQRINLAPGKYTAKLVNPSYNDTLRIKVEIKKNQTTVINKKLPGFDYAQILVNY